MLLRIPMWHKTSLNWNTYNGKYVIAWAKGFVEKETEPTLIISFIKVQFRCISKSIRLVLATVMNSPFIMFEICIFVHLVWAIACSFFYRRKKNTWYIFPMDFIQEYGTCFFYLTFLSIYFHRTHDSRASKMRSIHSINVFHSIMKSPEFNYSINKNDFNSISSIIQISNWCFSFIDFYCRIGKAREQKSKDQRN